MPILQRIREALRRLTRPRGADKALRILHGLAMIDEQLDDRELSFLRAFAKRWGFELDESLLSGVTAHTPESNSFTVLRDAMAEYLATKPPTDQAHQLRDVMTALVTIDGKICEHEELALDELGRMIDVAVGAGGHGAYTVSIKQRNDAITAREDDSREASGSVTASASVSASDGAAASNNVAAFDNVVAPECAMAPAAYGSDDTTTDGKRSDVVTVGTYYSNAYAELVANWYRDAGHSPRIAFVDGAERI